MSKKIRTQKNRTRKKSTIFRLFMIPLIAIMLMQSGITLGTLILRRTVRTLEEYSAGMMSRLVENRRLILQNDMNQRWAAVHEQEAVFDSILWQFLDSEGVTLEELLLSSELKGRLLELLFPECLDILCSNSTTGIFLVLTGTDMEAAGDYDGFFIRDSDPNTNPLNYTDLLLERGSKQLSRTWDIPLDTNWTTRFRMDGMGKNPADRYFYEPWRAGAAYGDAQTGDLGYWSPPFCLEKEGTDAYEMITYSLPLRHDGKVYGVLGVEISCKNLYAYLPAAELNDSQQSGYLLAVRDAEGSLAPLLGKGVLYSHVRSAGSVFSLQETKYGNLFLVQDIRLSGQLFYAVVCPLKLYSNNVPYEDADWVFIGLNTEQDLFDISRQLYFWLLVAIAFGLAFGGASIYFLVKHLTRPLQHLMQCIGGGSAALQKFHPSNILEVDALYDVIRNLTEKLSEEKERYKVALESSKDIFFSYDLQSRLLDLVNHRTMSGQWQCTDAGFLNLEYIYEPDRAAALEVLAQDTDNPYAEFRMRWPEESDFQWVALSAKAVYDTAGRRWKLVGSIRNIQEQKEREAEQLRKNMMDGVTGLYAFGTGMEQLAQCRKAQPDGFLVCLSVERLREINEKNGIVFGDMILEEVATLIQEQCGSFTAQTGVRAVALRLNLEELVLWLERCAADSAAEFTDCLLAAISARFPAEIFNVQTYAGIVRGNREQSGEELIRMAKSAHQFARSSAGQNFLCYENIPVAKRAALPPLQGQEVDSLGYDKDASLISLALNLFSKGSDFPAQMALMIQKIGRFYQAEAVRVNLLQADFNSNYLNYQWSRNGDSTAETVRKYREREKDAFYEWLGQSEAKYFSVEDSLRSEVQCFLSIEDGQSGILLPLYDSGRYMGNICVLGLGPERLEHPEECQNLAEIGRVVQSQLNQQQHDIASQAKSEFLSRMSHEIRTPMNGIIGMTSIALQQNQSPERMTDCLQKIQSSSRYLLGLINDILDMSKIESGKMKLEPANFHMDEMLATIQELILPQANAKKIDFLPVVQLEHRWFIADQMRISQVLINLLGNAIKFTPVGGKVTLSIRETESAGEGSLICFAVKDTGIGIAEEDQDRVFRSFEQASGANLPSQKGTGLGLSISRRLVQMMGSDIQLESAPGQGSTFQFAIFLTPGENEEAAAEAGAISFQGYRVLVVEDNELNCEIAQCILEERGFAVDCVYNGVEAVERMRGTAPDTYDVILMDIMMPVMDGLDATRAIRAMEREDCRAIPIIAMSANAFDDDLKKSVECGMNGHLSKPVEVDKLYQTLDRVLRGRESNVPG